MILTTRRQWLLGPGAGCLLGGGFLWSRFRGAVERAERRFSRRSQTMATAFGTLENAVAGSGPSRLMIYGTGGGFGHGLGFAAVGAVVRLCRGGMCLPTGLEHQRTKPNVPPVAVRTFVPDHAVAEWLDRCR